MFLNVVVEFFLQVISHIVEVITRLVINHSIAEGEAHVGRKPFHIKAVR